jgi:hypothetical protein
VQNSFVYGAGRQFGPTGGRAFGRSRIRDSSQTHPSHRPAGKNPHPTLTDQIHSNSVATTDRQLYEGTRRWPPPRGPFFSFPYYSCVTSTKLMPLFQARTLRPNSGMFQGCSANKRAKTIAKLRSDSDHRLVDQLGSCNQPL